MEPLNNSVMKASRKTKTDEFALEDMYTELENLSIGDFGFVKTGLRKESGRKETIKVIVKRKFDAHVIERKLNCLQLLSTYCSEKTNTGLPNEVGSIYWYKDTEKKIYIGSEFVQGTELQKLVLTKGPLSSFQVQHIIASLAKVIQGYQDVGLVYTDIRAEKILVTGNTDSLPDKNVPIKIIDNGNSVPAEKGVVSQVEFAKIYPKVRFV